MVQMVLILWTTLLLVMLSQETLKKILQEERKWVGFDFSFFLFFFNLHPAYHQEEPRTTYQQSRTTSTNSEPPRNTGRVVVANSAPPAGGRVIFMDVNAPRNPANVAPTPVRLVDGKMICARCGEPITTRVRTFFFWIAFVR